MQEKVLLKRISEDLVKIREKKPLIHHITNFVVMNETANLTLCLGALPIMAHAKEEVEEMVSFSSALVLNIGTLSSELVDSMILAGKKANEIGIPVVLDPVGVGATSMRTESAKRVLSDVDVAIIRGNAAEIAQFAGVDAQIRGVESMNAPQNIGEVASLVAREAKLTVAITGKDDFVSDGTRTAVIRNGHQMMSTVTGTGCMATTMVAGFASVNEDMFFAAIGGLVTFGIAGEVASRNSLGPGSFHAILYDSLYSVQSKDILTMGKLELQ